MSRMLYNKAIKKGARFDFGHPNKVLYRIIIIYATGTA